MNSSDHDGEPESCLNPASVRQALLQISNLHALPPPPLQADRDPREDDEVVMSDDEPSSVRHEGSDEEGEDLMDNMEA